MSGGFHAAVIVSVPLLPAASNAWIVIALPPTTNGTDALHDVVPVTRPHVLDAGLDHVILLMPTLSEAMPPSASGEDGVQYEADVVGDVIVTEGGVVSGAL